MLIPQKYFFGICQYWNLISLLWLANFWILRNYSLKFHLGTFEHVIQKLSHWTKCCICKYILIGAFLFFSFLDSCRLFCLHTFIKHYLISMFVNMLRAWSRASHFSDLHDITWAQLAVPDDGCQQIDLNNK